MIRRCLKFCPLMPVNGFTRTSSLLHLSSPLSFRAHMHSAAIIGAGPAGLTAVANMLDNGRRNVLWIDTAFQAGRVGRSYREVPR
jgi:heterodisulfide reductase subunit A-like polyferredoxin